MADITIIMPSYNKEKYIKEALDSVFMQETNYDYHIIVADDCSTDKTVEIVKKYQEKYPEKITLLTSEKNQKLYKNVLRAYEITKTDYFCVLDPDDFWIDKYKIQKALDFLEKNKDYTIYVTDTIMLYPNGEKKFYSDRKKITESTFDDFLNNKAELGCTLGSTFRNVVFKNGVPEKMKNLVCETQEQSFRGDTFRSVIHLHEGKAHCVPDKDAIYRVTEEGLWQGTNLFLRYLLNAIAFKDIWFYFDKKYPELLKISFLAFSQCKKDLITSLSEINDETKLKNTVKKLDTLNKIFNENQEIFYKNLSVKNKIRLKLYKILHKKLSKKGLV